MLWTAIKATTRSASDDKTIKVWETSTARLIKTLNGHTNWVYCLAVSPDGQLLASGSWDDTVRLWDLQSGVILQTFPCNNDVRTVSFSHDGAFLVGGDDAKNVYVWNVSTKQLLRTISGHSDWLRTAVYTPDDRWLLTAADDQAINVWDAATGRLVRSWTADNASIVKGVKALAISPDSRLIASGGGDTRVKLWDFGGSPLWSWAHPQCVLGVAFSADGSYMATACADNSVRIWRVAHSLPLIDIGAPPLDSMVARFSAQFQALEEALSRQDWKRADDLSIEILRQSSGRQMFDSDQAARSIPAEILKTMHLSWKSHGQSLKGRNWVATASGVTTYVALFSLKTYLERRLAEVGLS
jgi:WD40 repeat protein